MIRRLTNIPKLWSLSIGLLFGSIISAQTISDISLDSCIQLAVKNYPLSTHAAYLQTISDNAIRQINAGMLPQLTFTGEATYQSEAVAFDVPGFPSMAASKDNYSFGLQLNQVLYDFGKLNQSKAVERAQVNYDLQRNEIDLYGLRTTIVQLYSQILLTKENIKILDSYIESIKVRYDDMESAVASGVVLQSNLDILYAEMQRTNQQLTNAHNDLQSAEQTLSLYTRISFDTATVFSSINQSGLYTTKNVLRPEQEMYDAQLQLLDERKTLENRNKAPRLYVFGEGVFGRPGYDMLNENLRLYGTLGIGLRWNINSLYNNSIASQNLSISKNIVKEQRLLFEIQQNSELIKHKTNINRYTKLIDTDAAILDKYTNITATAANQLENGIITSTDYLTRLYTQKQAELNKQIHLIQLQLAVIEYNLTAGTN